MTDAVTPSTNGPLFDAQGNLVKFKPTKAVIGGALGFASLIVTGLGTLYTESPTLTVLGIVIGGAATTLGIYLPTNKAVKA